MMSYASTAEANRICAFASHYLLTTEFDFEQIRNMVDPHYARLLAEHLEERRDTEARLSADAVRLAARAIRVYPDLLVQPKPQDDLDQAFVVEMIDDLDHIEETLAKASNVIVARAAFDAACTQRPGRKVVLRKGARVIERAGTE